MGERGKRWTDFLCSRTLSDDDKIKPQGLTIPFIVPDGLDITSNDDKADVVDNQSDWDKDVKDGTISDNENIVEADMVVDEEDECEENAYI